MIDLHMHSYFSDDGEFSPEELVQQCIEANLTEMSITDHNCARANAAAEKEAKKLGIRYIPGIEIDAVHENIGFHILGYGIDYESEDFIKIEEQVVSQGKEASLFRLEKTKELGFDVTKEELEALLKDLIELGLDGIKAFSSYHTTEMAEYFYEAAQKDGLFVSCGSDYHGKTKPAVKLGGYTFCEGAQRFTVAMHPEEAAGGTPFRAYLV